MALELNVKAPDVTLSSHKGETVKLSEQWAKGPVVLAFFPLAFTGTCTEEMCEFRDTIAEFGSLKSQVFGVSVDSRFALAAFAEKNSIEFPLLSDFNKEAINAFGCAYDNFIGMHGVSKRSVFVIDGKGHIAYKWISEDAKQKPNLTEVREALGKL